MPGLLQHILKNLVSSSATRLYPAQVRKAFPNCRGDLEISIQTCKLCGHCARTCPTGCLSVDKDVGLWQRDPFSCIFCGECVEACPADALTMVSTPRPPHPRIYSIQHLKSERS